MQISLVSIFPQIFDSFLNTSIIEKAQAKEILEFRTIDPRDFCHDKHKKIDDEIYGGGQGMLMKAKPVADAVEQAIAEGKTQDFQIIFLKPSQTVFNQELATHLSQCDHLIIVSGRYEGIDHRFCEHMQETYGDKYKEISLGQFIVLGGEAPAMVMIEAIVRLIPGVIKEELSWQDESYSPDHNMQNLEYPQYTRPEEVFGKKVPDTLLSGHHANIEQWKQDQMGETS